MRFSKKSNHLLGACLFAAIQPVLIARGDICGDVFVSPEAFSDMPSDLFALVFPERVPETAKDLPSPTLKSNPIPQALLRGFERFGPLETTGFFLYFPHCFPEMDETVYICQFDHWKSGGSFLGCVLSNGIPNAVGCAIDQCEYWEWFRLGMASGETNLAVIAMEHWRDGSENAGCDRERFLSVFKNESGKIVRSDSYRGLGDLIGSPAFSFLERPDIIIARRDETGSWNNSSPSDDRCAPSLPRASTGDSSDIQQSFFEYLQSRPVSFTTTTQVVFEQNPSADSFFALLSDESDQTAEGGLWHAFLLGSSGWAPAPEKGFACSSGWCPSSFRAKSTDFFKLYLFKEQPRLVVAANHNGRVEELFWNEGIAKKPHRFDFRNGYPNRHYTADFGLPNAPISFFQSLNAIPNSPFQRIERINPMIVKSQIKTPTPTE